MKSQKAMLIKGSVLMASFTAVFILIFMPLFSGGKNGLEYLDNLYNSISKGSAYYIPELKEASAPLAGSQVSMTLEMTGTDAAAQALPLLRASGVTAEQDGTKLRIGGDLGKLLDNCLEDADLMYNNKGEQVRDKYGMDERRALYTWWTLTKLMDKELKNQKLFKAAKVVTTVSKKGVETSYNFYKIEPRKISEKLGVVVFSLAFYVVYTVWYGFAIMFLFEGLGLRLEH
ncbi:MAG: hypothetical protein MI802_11260 [Desulfobacterales bacterium]|nr:hypothetical protein [Desulfobacterales bacterium]